MFLNLFLATLVCGPLSCVGSNSESTFTCPSKLVSSARLLLNSYRNDEGKWESQVGLTHPGGPPVLAETVPWSVTVEHNITSTCHGGEEITILATLTNPDGTTCNHFFNTSVTNPKKVPEGYELFPGVGYYKFYSNGDTWASARKVCSDEGAHLTIINSENEANVMKQLFTRYPREKLTNAQGYDGIWVGLYEQAANGRYFTIFGASMNQTGFTRWHPGKPDQPGSDECVLIYRHTAGYYDYPCLSTVPFVCEVD